MGEKGEGVFITCFQKNKQAKKKKKNQKKNCLNFFLSIFCTKSLEYFLKIFCQKSATRTDKNGLGSILVRKWYIE